MEVDHFAPQKHFPELANDYSNLYYCCRRCNQRKAWKWPSEEDLAAGMRWLDPCIESWYSGEHLSWADDGTVGVHSAAGRFTAAHLKLEDTSLVLFRREFREVLGSYFAWKEEIVRLRELLARVYGSESLVQDLTEALLAKYESDLSTLLRRANLYFGALWDVELRTRTTEQLSL